MSRGRDDAGRFEETVTEQDLLRVFDYDDDPVLTAPEVTEGLRQFGKTMTSEGVRNRLDKLADKGLVERKDVGARAVVWWATVAPELAPATADRVETRRDSDEWESL
jgi:repressor of nif and glnA expression